jgi:hypothetical protein
MHARAYISRSRRNGIPPAVQIRTERRILDYAAKHCGGKFARVEVRFRGALCYIDAYTEPDTARDGGPIGDETEVEWMERLRETPIHLCRIRYLGSENRWGFAWYSYAHEKYEPSFLLTGSHQGTPEEAFATSTLFY